MNQAMAPNTTTVTVIFPTTEFAVKTNKMPLSLKNFLDESVKIIDSI